jgi:hypothetical protein
MVAPETGIPLGLLDDATLVSDRGIRYPIANKLPRFVAQDNYAQAFGKQWHRFPKTQLDSHTGLRLSEARLARCMRGYLPDVRGKLVLEAGSGTGLFTEILLKHGGNGVVAFCRKPL